MAEALFQAKVINDYPALAAHTLIHSAGTSAIEGNPSTSSAIQAMDLWGIDLEPHRASELTAGMLLKADMVLAMAREHLLIIGRMEPQALKWSTTLRHLASKSDTIIARLGNETVHDEIAARSRIKKVFEVLGESTWDEDYMTDVPARGSDIIDPIGGSLQVYLGVAEDIESSIDDILVAVFGRTETSGGA
jgi:protein-tyrosine-phosphatase